MSNNNRLNSSGVRKWTLRGKLDLLMSIIGMFLYVSLYAAAKAVDTVVKYLRDTKKDIRGQVALVTGGGNGLGKEIAKELAREGCNVAVVDIDIENAQKTAEEAQALGVEAKAYQVDVSSLKEIEELKTQVHKDLGIVDILVNNAGILYVKGITEEKPDVLSNVMNVNLMSHIWTTRVFLPHMIERRRGHIVGVASLGAYRPAPEALTYNASKYGVRGFMDALHMDLYEQRLHHDIRATTFAPFFLRTNRTMLDRYYERATHRVDFSPKDAARALVQGVRKNKTLVTFPWMSYWFYCVANPPVGIQQRMVGWFLRPGKPRAI